MNKALKIVIISLLAVLVIGSLALFFFFKPLSGEEAVVAERKNEGWENLKLGDFNSFLANNFPVELVQGIDARSFAIYGILNKQYNNENSRIIYARDDLGVYMRSFCDALDLFIKIDNVDPDSFEVLGDCYSKDKNNVYFTNVVILGADPVTFEVIEENYSKDSKGVYFQKYKITGADIGTFLVTLNGRRGGYYSKDKNYIYKEHLPVTDLNAKKIEEEKEDKFVDCLNERISTSSLEIIDGNFIKDENGVYLAINAEGALNYCDKIEGADPFSFEVISGLWSKDASGIFHDSQKLNGGVVNVETFEIIDDNFAKDSSNVYYQEEVIVEADPETFVKVSDSYAKDDENVYLNEEVIVEADPETFEVVVDNDDEQYGVDEVNVYDGSEIVEDVDPETFDVEELTAKEIAMTCLPESVKASVDIASFTEVGNCHAKDNNYVFFRANCGQDCAYTEMQANSGSFEEIRLNHSKDANNIYYLGFVIVGADKLSFVVLSGSISYSKDSQNVYFGEKIIPGADPATFEVLSDNWAGGFLSKDKDNFYNGIEIIEENLPDTFVDTEPVTEGENCYFKKGNDAHIEKYCN